MKHSTNFALLAVTASVCFASCSGEPDSESTKQDTKVGSTVSSVSVTGLIGRGLVLQDASGNLVPIPKDGIYELPLASAAHENLVYRNPLGPVQRCAVIAGDQANAPNTSSTAVRCTTESARFAYTLNFASNSTASYRLNGLTGELQIQDSLSAGKGPISGAADAQNRHWFVVSAASATLSAFAIDQNSGYLSEFIGSPYATGGSGGGFGIGPSFVTVHPSGRFVYVSNGSGANNIAGFAIDGAAGTLRPLNRSPFPAGAKPLNLVINRRGDIAYLANRDSNDIYVYGVDNQSGELTELKEIRTRVKAAPGLMLLHNSGRFLAVGTAQGLAVMAIDARSGALSEISGSPVVTQQGADPTFAAHPNGRFYFVRSPGNSDQVGTITTVSLDTSSRSAAIAGEATSIAAYASYMEIDPSGEYLAVLAARRRSAGGPPARAGSITIYRINQDTGALNRVHELTTTDYFPYTLRFDPSGRFVYITSVSPSLIYCYRLDQATGALRPVPARPAERTPDQPISLTIIGAPPPAN